PFANLGRQPDARAGPGKFPHRPIDSLESRARFARLRLFRPQHSRSKGHRLRKLPRTRRSNAPHLEGPLAAHAVVPGLPSSSGKVRTPGFGGVLDAMDA